MPIWLGLYTICIFFVGACAAAAAVAFATKGAWGSALFMLAVAGVFAGFARLIYNEVKKHFTEVY